MQDLTWFDNFHLHPWRKQNSSIYEINYKTLESSALKHKFSCTPLSHKLEEFFLSILSRNPKEYLKEQPRCLDFSSH